MRYDQPAPDFPHLGQPDNLTSRAAADWRRRNTYYIQRGEHLSPEVLAARPACFTTKEWTGYISSVPSDGWRLDDSPWTVQNESTTEATQRQLRAAPAVACDDCTLAHQLSERMAGRCHPPQYAITPVKRLMESEFTEGSTDVAAPRTSPSRSDVLFEESVPE